MVLTLGETIYIFKIKIGQIDKISDFPDIKAELDVVFNHLLTPDLPFLHLKAKQIKAIRAEKLLIRMSSQKVMSHVTIRSILRSH